MFNSAPKFQLYILIIFVLCLAKSSVAQELKVIKYTDLAKIIESKEGDLKVINFWATWCRPCVKELPQFEALQEKYQSKGLEMILVSFDFVEQLEKANKFASSKGLKSTLYLLDETDYNAFIDKIDPSWSGAIPATLMIDNRNDKRAFFEKEFHEGELETTFIDFVN